MVLRAHARCARCHSRQPARPARTGSSATLSCVSCPLAVLYYLADRGTTRGSGYRPFARSRSSMRIATARCRHAQPHTENRQLRGTQHGAARGCGAVGSVQRSTSGTGMPHAEAHSQSRQWRPSRGCLWPTAHAQLSGRRSARIVCQLRLQPAACSRHRDVRLSGGCVPLILRRQTLRQPRGHAARGRRRPQASARSRYGPPVSCPPLQCPVFLSGWPRSARRAWRAAARCV